MIGRTNAGGVGKLFSVIAVSYPAGSVCTCTDGTKTLTAKDTSGTALFHVPNTGTWTVSCTDGSRTASQPVSITAENQSVNVALVYEFYIFDYRTASWQPQAFQTLGIPANSSATRVGTQTVTPQENGSIIISQRTTGGGSVYSTAGFVIDLTNYKKLTFVGNINVNNASAGCSICVWNGLQGYWQQNIVAAVSGPLEGVTDIDITNLVGSYSIGFGLYDSVDIGLWQIILS